MDLKYALKEELPGLVMDRLEMRGEGEREIKADFRIRRETIPCEREDPWETTYEDHTGCHVEP